jgi:hypothetical protein
MTDANDNGGPAFPIYEPRTDDMGGFLGVYYARRGMTLHDWFAGRALTNPEICEGVEPIRDAAWAYEWADAMIAEKRRREMKTAVRGQTAPGVLAAAIVRGEATP